MYMYLSNTQVCPYTFHTIHLQNSTSKRGLQQQGRQWSSGARANKASTCSSSMSALLLFCWKLCSTLNSWGYSAVITMPTQKQRLVNLTQTARHEVKMDTSTFLILTHWSPGLFFPFEVHNRQGFLPNPWGPMVIHHFDSSTPHHHPQLILQAENCLPTWYIRRWCCCCCHRHWCCHIWDRRNHDDDGQHWDDLCKKEEWCQGEIVPDPVLTPIDVSGNFFFRSYD